MILNKYILLAFAVFASMALFACSDDNAINVIDTGDDTEEPDNGDDDDNGDDEDESFIYGLTVEVGDDGVFTFLVDLTDFEGFDPEEHTVYVTGNPFGWTEPGTEEDQVMVRVENDEMPESSGIVVEAGEEEYKYFSTAVGDGWDGGEWEGGDNRSTTIEAGEVQEDVFGVEPE